MLHLVLEPGFSKWFLGSLGSELVVFRLRDYYVPGC